MNEVVKLIRAEGETGITTQAMLDDVLVDMLTLALSIKGLRARWPACFTYKVGRNYSYPKEMFKISALTKMRSLRDFLYGEGQKGNKNDDILITEFSEYGFGSFLPLPELKISKDDMNKFTAHLTKARITGCSSKKTKDGAQEKVSNPWPVKRIEQDAMSILRDAKKFVDCVTKVACLQGSLRYHEAFEAIWRELSGHVPAESTTSTASPRPRLR